MFEQAMVLEMHRTNRAWTTLMGVAGQFMLVSAAVVVPLVSPQTLPRPQLLVSLFLPTPPPPPPPVLQPVRQATNTLRRDLQLRANILTAPSSIPARPVMIEEPPLSAAELGPAVSGVPGGVPGGIEGGVLGGMTRDMLAQVARPEPAVPPAPAARPAEKPANAPPVRLRVGGQVQQARIVHQVLPVYPPLARQARVSGSVDLIGVIAADGRIKELKVVSGHPLLIGAALDAVRQWRYRPTTLNGDPVEVVAPITVMFLLN